MNIKVRKSKVWIFLRAMILTLGIFGIIYSADAKPSYLDSYNAAHGTNETSCQLCHTNSIPALNSTGQTFKDSGHNPCSIGPATGQCAPTVTAPVISSFTATPPSITTGQSSTLAWTLSGGAPTSLSINNGVGSVLGSTSKAVTPGTTTTYTLTASNSGGSVTRSVTVTVTPPAPVISSFTATPASITSGQSSTLAWSLSGGAPTTLSINSSVGSVLGSTSRTVSPTTTTTYTLTASNSAGSVSQSATVTVTAAPPVVTAPVISSLTADPGSITAGQFSTLAWSLSGGAPTSLSIDNGVGSVLGLTSKAVTPGATTTYTLTASNSAGSVTQPVTVTVAEAPQSGSLDLKIWVGQWFKVTSRYNGYFAQGPTLSSSRSSVLGYLRVRSWDPDKNVLEADLYEHDSESNEWVSETFPLQILGGSTLDFICGYQAIGNFASGFTARVQGREAGGVLQSASFRTMGGFYIEARTGFDSKSQAEASEHYAGGLSMIGTLISESMVPVPGESITH